MHPQHPAARARHTRIKFCGFTRAEDIAVARSLGVEYLGLVFAPRSPRRITLETARALRHEVSGSAGIVALLMDQPEHEVHAVIDAIAPDILQFHGSERDSFCAAFGLPFWKAIGMGEDPASGLAQVARYPSAAAFVFDGHAAGAAGGSGQRFDWSLLPGTLGHQHLLLAGGLNASNVAKAIRTAAPWGVDLSSHIESAPGIKDHQRMRRFVEAVCQADKQIGNTSQSPCQGQIEMLSVANRNVRFYST